MKIIKIIVILVVFSFLNGFAFANQSQEDFISELSLRTEFKAIIYEEKSSKSKQSYFEARIQPKVVVEINDSSNLVLEGDFRLDSENFAAGIINSMVESNERWAVNFKKAYFDWKGEKFSLKIGKQISDWSVTDTISPMDVLNPRDWMFLADWERVGISAFDLRFDEENYFLEIVAVPKFTASKLPKGRWEEDFPLGITAEEMVDENQFQYALRAGVNWREWDLTAAFYDGVSYNPYGLLNGAILELRYSKEKVYAFSALREIDRGYILKGELGYYDQDHGDNFWQYVVGIRKEFDGVFTPTDTLSILVQYANEKVVSSDESIVRVPDFRRDLNNSMLTRISYEKGAGSCWRLELEGTMNLDDGDYFVCPKIIYFKDYWQVEIGLQLVGGPQESFWGKYDKVNAFLANLILYF